MDTARIVLGGIAGGVVYNAVSIVVNMVALGERYRILQDQGIYRKQPRLPFFPIWIVMMILVSIGLAWLYAASRSRLGPGPKTAIAVGLVVALIAGIPGAFAEFCWGNSGGYVALWRVVEIVIGMVLATLTAGWLYKEQPVQ